MLRFFNQISFCCPRFMNLHSESSLSRFQLLVFWSSRHFYFTFFGNLLLYLILSWSSASFFFPVFFFPSFKISDFHSVFHLFRVFFGSDYCSFFESPSCFSISDFCYEFGLFAVCFVSLSFSFGISSVLQFFWTFNYELLFFTGFLFQLFWSFLEFYGSSGSSLDFNFRCDLFNWSFNQCMEIFLWFQVFSISNPSGYCFCSGFRLLLVFKWKRSASFLLLSSYYLFNYWLHL